MAQTSRGAALAHAGAGNTAETAFALHFDYHATSDEAARVAEACLQATVKSVVQLDAPRIGVLCYAFAKARAVQAEACDDATAASEPPVLHFTEMWADTDAAATMHTEMEGEAFAEMFVETANYSKLVVGAVNPPRWHDGLMNSFGGLGACLVDPLVGQLVNPVSLDNKWIRKRGDAMRCKSELLFMLELRLEPKSDEHRARLLELLRDIVSPKGDVVCISAYVVDSWWHPRVLTAAAPEPPAATSSSVFSARALALYIIDSKPATFCNHVLTQRWADGVLAHAAAHSLVYTAQQWGEEHGEAADTLAGRGLNLAETRELFAGYLLHPYYTQDWEGDRTAISSDGSTNPTSRSSPPAPAHASPSQPPPPPPSFEQYFTLRRHVVTNFLEALVFSKDELAKKPPADAVAVPVLTVVRSLCRVGRNDAEVPAGHLFGQLARLRALLRDAQEMNEASDEDIENDAALGDRVHRLLQLIAIFQAGMPAEGRLPLVFPGVAELIAVLEQEYSGVVCGAREAIATGAPVEYMGLQELYAVGGLVTTASFGALGGTRIALRVIDLYYEPYRSMFGARKYSCHVVLETVVGVGGEFLAVSFVHLMPDWVGGRDPAGLELTPVTHASQLPAEVASRGQALASLAGAPAFRHYRAGTFFAHKRGQHTAVGGVREASGGQLVVDTHYGLQLGHAPASTQDDLGMAIATSFKAYKQALQSGGKHETTKMRIDRMRGSGMRVFETLPPSMEVVAWPTVVAFSMAIKQWGHVLVDGLSPIPASSDAWKQLVLPQQVKEMLCATAAASLRGENKASGCSDDMLSSVDKEARKALDKLSKKSRYSPRDVVDTKGSGSLFLLYGPPGTGKTLSVEALARLFGRPLYVVSFAELGASVSELEERLSDVLALASLWGALVLLDEGDALVERRRRGQLLQNAMGAVLLRLLESFNGALFITSNRASAFDPAALSRVTLAVRYEPLDSTGKTAVWRNALARVFADEEIACVGDAIACVGDAIASGHRRQRRGEAAAFDFVDSTFDLSRLAEFGGSGRSVGAVVRLAIGLADERDCDLSQAVLDDALAVWSGFHADLVGEGVAQDWKEDD